MGEFFKNNESVEAEQKAIQSLMEAACSIRHDLDSISSDFSISRPQLSVLHILKEAYPEGCSRGQIIDGLAESRPDVTRLVDRLEEEGLVERYRSEQDARVSVTKITDKGQKVYEEALDVYLDYLARISRVLTKKECETLSGICRKLSKKTCQFNTLNRSA